MSDFLKTFIPSLGLIERLPSDRTRLGRFFRLPFGLIPRGWIIPILQGKLRGKKWIVGSSVHACWLGSYEYEKQSIFSKSVREGCMVFDIGANVGFYTLLSSLLVGPSGKVFAFEPSPDNLYYLKRHIQLNGIANVSIIEAAVSDRSGFAFFNESQHNSQGHLSPEGKILVRTTCLDELYLQKEVLIPDFVKIDVEGAELSVLLGAKSLISASMPTIFLATHGAEVHQQCVDFLSSLNYKLEMIGGSRITCSKEIVAYK